MLHDPRTEAILARLRNRAFEKAATSVAEWLANELKIARFDFARLFDEGGNLLPLSEVDPDSRAAIQAIEVKEERVENAVDDGQVVSLRTRVKRIRVHSKDGAQDRLARYLGAYEQNNAQRNSTMRMVEAVPADALALIEQVLIESINSAGAS